MAKGQMRGNKEIRKPKTATPKPPPTLKVSPFAVPPGKK